jgi:hypothetical protein
VIADRAKPLPECCQEVAKGYEQHLHDLEVELRQKRAALTRLRGAHAMSAKVSALRPYADEVFEAWKREISPKARVFSDKRLKNTLDRLREGEDDIEARTAELIEAIMGAKHGAYTNPKTGVTYDDLELIMRDDSNVERFRKIWHKLQTKPELRPRANRPEALDPKRPPAFAPPIAWVLYRVDLAGQWWVQGDAQQGYFFPCLAHGFDGTLAQAKPIGGTVGSFIRLLCAAGCEEEAIMEAYAMDGTDLVSIPGGR